MNGCNEVEGGSSSILNRHQQQVTTKRPLREKTLENNSFTCTHTQTHRQRQARTRSQHSSIIAVHLFLVGALIECRRRRGLAAHDNSSTTIMRLFVFPVTLMMIGMRRVSVPSPLRPAFAICFPSSRRANWREIRESNKPLDWLYSRSPTSAGSIETASPKFQPIISATAAATTAVAAFHSFWTTTPEEDLS